MSKILIYSSHGKCRKKMTTDERIFQLRKKLGLNQKYERKMFAIRTDMKLITLHERGIIGQL